MMESHSRPSAQAVAANSRITTVILLVLKNCRFYKYDISILQAEPVITGQIFFRANSRTRGMNLPFVVAAAE